MISDQFLFIGTCFTQPAALSRVKSHMQNLCENQPEGTFKGGFFPPIFFVKKLVPQVTTEEYIYLVDIPVGILEFGIVWPQKGEGNNKKNSIWAVFKTLVGCLI